MNKQTFITFLLAVVTMTLQGQTFTPLVEDSVDYVITGTTNSTYDSVVVFPCAPYGDRMKFPIRDGKFTVKDRKPRHMFVQIGDNEGNDLHFIVEEMPTHINLVTGEVTGSELQKRFIRCQMRERVISNVAEPWWDSLSDDEKDRIITMRIDGLPDATAKDSANVKKYNGHMADLVATNLQNIRENIDNVIPAWYLYTGKGSLSPEQMDEFMREDAPYARHPAMERPWKYYWGMQKRGAITGKTAPDFEAEAPDGTKHRLSDYLGRGQYVLLDFWASWCGPCIASFPFMKELYATYKDRGLHFIGVSCDKDRTAWLKALDKHQLPWTALLSPSREGDARDIYGVTGIPTVILISPDGTIISTELEGKALAEKLAEIF